MKPKNFKSMSFLRNVIAVFLDYELLPIVFHILKVQDHRLRCFRFGL